MIAAASRKAMTTVRRRRPRVEAQLELRPVKLDKNGQRRGGARKGAGRPRKPGRRPAPHRKRPEINKRHAHHVTLRVLGRVGWLRRLDMYDAIRVALAGPVGLADFRIVHYSVQNDHIHLLCEAENRKALRAGVASFEISAAKRINAILTRRRKTKHAGQVFADRYHVESISSPTQVRNCLAYVMNNWRKHGCDKREPGFVGGRLDPYSSAVLFPGWKERTRKCFHFAPGFPFPITSRPQTWLLLAGWKLARPISVYETPGVPGSRTGSAKRFDDRYVGRESRRRE